VQYPGLQGGGALGDASTPGTPDDSIATSAHGDTYSHVSVAGETWGGEKGAAAGTAAAAARRRRATPTGGAFTPLRSASVTAPVEGRPTSRRNRGRRAGTITRGSSRSRSTPVVAARGRRAQRGAVGEVVGGQAPSGPCDPCGRTGLLSHATLLAFSVIATLPTSTRPQIPESTPNNVFPKSECVYVLETCLPNAPRGSILALGVGDGSTATSGTPNRREKTRI